MHDHATRERDFKGNPVRLGLLIVFTAFVGLVASVAAGCASVGSAIRTIETQVQTTEIIVTSVVVADAVRPDSMINITEEGLAHIFDRHLAEGSLSAGKSLFNDKDSIAPLIASAAGIVPITQENGNLAYVVDARRVVGVDRETGQATSVYTVITKPGGDLVTAFPGNP